MRWMNCNRSTVPVNVFTGKLDPTVPPPPAMGLESRPRVTLYSAPMTTNNFRMWDFNKYTPGVLKYANTPRQWYLKYPPVYGTKMGSKAARDRTKTPS
jgi:hypothetical protein